MEGILEVDDYVTFTVNKTDVPVFLNGGQSFSKNPGSSILGWNRDLARVHIIVATFVLRTENGQ